MQEEHELRLEFAQDDISAETYVTRTWKGLSVQFSRLRMPSDFSFSWEGTTHYLAHHDIVLLEGEMVVNGGRPVPGGDLRDNMTFVPAGQLMSGWARPADRLNSFTVVAYEPHLIEEEVQTAVSQDGLEERVYFREDVLGATMRKLASIMSDTGGQVSQAYVEAVALTATLEIGRVLRQHDSIPVSGKLANRQCRMLLEFIDARLATDIGLDDMASVCGLSRFHFSRAFKATFGEPPYRYLTRQRIDLAKKLLATSTLPVTEVAAACGFNGTTQFARAFRDFENMAPLEFRRSAR